MIIYLKRIYISLFKIKRLISNFVGIRLPFFAFLMFRVRSRIRLRASRFTWHRPLSWWLLLSVVRSFTPASTSWSAPRDWLWPWSRSYFSLNFLPVTLAIPQYVSFLSTFITLVIFVKILTSWYYIFIFTCFSRVHDIRLTYIRLEKSKKSGSIQLE